MQQRRVIAALLVVTIVVSAFAFLNLRNVGPSSTLTHPETSYGITAPTQKANMTRWALEKPCSYQISTDGINVWAQDCDTGTVVYSGTNASSVINSAISALANGGVVYMKAGTYTITSTINVIRNGIYLVGEGFSTRILSSTASIRGVTVLASRVILDGFRVDLTPEKGTHMYGIYLRGGSNITVSNLWVTGGRPGIFPDSVTGLLVEGNIIYDSNGDGFGASNTNNAIIRDNYIINAGLTIGNCLSLSSDSNVTAIGNHLDHCLRNAIGIENSIGLGTGRNILVANNFIRDVQAHGISIYPPNGEVPTAAKVDIVGNTLVGIWGINSNGINISSGDQVSIANNYIANVTHAGIIINDGAGTQFSITGNMISNVGNAAIASDCPLTTISGNTVMGLEQQGIYVNANSTTVNGNTVIYDAGGKTNYGGITVTSGTSGVVISGNTLRYPYMGIILAGNNYDVAVTGNLINAPAFIGIGFAASVYKSTVSGNIIQAASAPAMSNAGMSLIGGSVIVTANIVDGTAVGFTTNCISLANSLNFTVMENQVDRCTYGIREVSGDDYNLIANNYFGATIRNSLTVVGTHDQVFHNFGYNPQPPAAIMVTASPFTYTNTHGYVELVTVSANGATIDEIDLRGENTNLTAGSFLLYPGDSITLTYSGGTPLMERYPQ